MSCTTSKQFFLPPHHSTYYLPPLTPAFLPANLTIPLLTPSSPPLPSPPLPSHIPQSCSLPFYHSLSPTTTATTTITATTTTTTTSASSPYVPYRIISLLMARLMPLRPTRGHIRRSGIDVWHDAVVPHTRINRSCK